MPNLFDHTAFVQFRQTNGINRRTNVWLSTPVPTQARIGPIEILGIPGHWELDVIVLNPPVTPQMGEVIEEMCRESVQRGRPLPTHAEPRLRPQYIEERAARPSALFAAAGGGIRYEERMVGQLRGSGQQVFWPGPIEYSLKPPPAPPRAPRCACGDRSNSRWEHHSGGCTYLDPDVTDFYNEPPEPDDED